MRCPLGCGCRCAAHHAAQRSDSNSNSVRFCWWSTVVRSYHRFPDGCVKHIMMCCICCVLFIRMLCVLCVLVLLNLSTALYGSSSRGHSVSMSLELSAFMLRSETLTFSHVFFLSLALPHRIEALSPSKKRIRKENRRDSQIQSAAITCLPVTLSQ